MLLVLNLPLVGLWVKLLRIPRPYLYAGILTFASLGSFAVNADPLDLVILMGLGLLGFAMRRFGWPVAPAVIGLILGPIAETNLRRALAISDGDLSVLVDSWFSRVVLLLACSPWSGRWCCAPSAGAGPPRRRSPSSRRRPRGAEGRQHGDWGASS